MPWLEQTALVLCDLQDHHHHKDLPHSPRGILRRQVARLAERGYIGYFASELEFYLLNESYDAARAKHWHNLESASPYIGDYQIGITTNQYLRAVVVPLRLKNLVVGDGAKLADRAIYRAQEVRIG